MLKAGVAKIDITPPIGIPLAGSFHPRLGTHVEERLHARALVLEQNGRRHAVVTADVLGFRCDMVARLRRHCRRRFGIEVILFNASHCHCGPNVCWEWCVKLPIHTRRLERAYRRTFERKLRQVIAAATRRLQPVSVRYGAGTANFGINRRRKRNGVWDLLPNPKGFHDKTVAVFQFATPAGKPVAILFSHACHPTTRYGTEISTDFPGVACRLIESRTGAVALFAQGACADIRPNITKPGGRAFCPGSRADVNREGRELAGEVGRVLRQEMKSLVPALDACEIEVQLPFDRPLTKAELRRFDHPFLVPDLKRTWVRRMRRGQLAKSLPMPILLLQLSPGQTIIATGHELCNGYVPLLQSLTHRVKLTVLGYTNDYHAYVPTRKVQREGGYEGDWSFYSYLLPAKFHPSVEQVILSTGRKLLTRVSP